MTLKIVCHFCQNLTGNLTSLTKMTFNFGDNGHKKVVMVTKKVIMVTKLLLRQWYKTMV